MGFFCENQVESRKIDTMSKIAQTPEPPYYAVIFTSHRSENDHNYRRVAEEMAALASKQPGYLGIESARETIGITVSYWSDLESIRAWKQNAEHLSAQQRGKEIWYQDYKVRICEVERDYGFERDVN